MKKFKIRTAKSLLKRLEHKPTTKREQLEYYYLKGIYDASVFGLCIYRLKPSCDFKKLDIKHVSGSTLLENNKKLKKALHQIYIMQDGWIGKHVEETKKIIQATFKIN